MIRSLVVSVAIPFSAGLLPTGAHADSCNFPATIQSEPEVHGDVTIRRILDARRDRKYPDFSIEVTKGDKLLARIPGVYYEKLFAAPDGSVFVGLSNHGLPGTAVVVLDREGRLRFEVKHGFAEFDYCERSVTLRRVWFDADKPNVIFTKEPKWGYYDVKVRTCRGKEVDLMAEIQDAYGRAFRSKTPVAR